ncbi:NAD(P)H-hydrate dehydratase [Williamsia deligens]|uniref:Bifunctional NAD(P)H-hydrate repair enzyme n=1 Tax=Williamsia deligens TaxID=321325 RepID=A0ABW3G989_9NOCA|nr:NAD(P)H-hydrate dehydratase [Williamsia deligens]MCP2192386.1 yjeF C-terminal region, hydroxyethylthiazole kinase-related/yjeF N-terminal region [Williamsia deligens]
MLGFHTASAIRAAEEATGDLLTGGVLMRRASAGLASVVIAELLARRGAVYGARVGLVVGSGDNGGDALYAGARLVRRGVSVVAVALDRDRAHESGSRAFTAAGGRWVSTMPSDVDLVVDGVVGLGGSGPLRPVAAGVFAGVRAPIVAVDLPSGVDADTGEIHTPAVHAAVTVTFGARRRAHVLASSQCGRVVCVDIGIDPGAAGLVALSDSDIAREWPVPGPVDDKYTQGVVGVIAGSDRYPGAAVLCSGAAVAATSGMVRYVGSAAEQVVARRPEIVAAPDLDAAGRVQAWVVGPGAGTDDAAEDLLRRILAADVPVLVDADGLTVVARHPEWLTGRDAPTLLTPHAGEFARLAGHEVGADRVSAVSDLAARLEVTVLLKGRVTLVSDAAGPVIANDAGSSWAATAGAGDVLSGIAGALLASGLAPRVAAAAAARVHADAARLAAHGSDPTGHGAPIGASDLLAAVPAAIRDIRSAGSGHDR